MELNADRNFTFVWEAYHADGTVVKQFNDQGDEMHFGHIDLPTVEEFVLVSRNLSPSLKFSIELKTGDFYRNDQILFPNQTGKALISKIGEKEYNKAKLIFFRRVKKTFTPGVPTVNTNISYFMGWETLDNKTLVEIDEGGNVSLTVV